MAHADDVRHGCPDGEHTVQLFDSTASRVAAISVFVREGLLRGEVVLLVTTPAHWDAVARQLVAAHVPVAAVLASGQLNVRDAARTLAVFRRSTGLDRQAFDDHAGALVRRLLWSGNRLRVYGEIVDLLAADADYRSAIDLEDWWNALGAGDAFTLFCGYAAADFGHPGHAAAIHAICRAHSQLRVNPRDVIGTFLVTTQAGPAWPDPSTRH